MSDKDMLENRNRRKTVDNMSLFQEATNQMAYAKFGFFGFQGSGKSFTAALVALGLHKFIKSEKPVCFIDTETGADFLKPMFDKAGVKMLVAKTQAFAQLIKAIDEAQGVSDILIIDSITHFWRELMKAHKAKYNRKFLRIQDFGPLKDEWKQYSDRYVNSKLHIVMCGRAANIFEDAEENDGDEGGQKTWKADQSRNENVRRRRNGLRAEPACRNGKGIHSGRRQVCAQGQGD